jgi:hypothetical protein
MKRQGRPIDGRPVRLYIGGRGEKESPAATPVVTPSVAPGSGLTRAA